MGMTEEEVKATAILGEVCERLGAGQTKTPARRFREIREAAKGFGSQTRDLICKEGVAMVKEGLVPSWVVDEAVKTIFGKRIALQHTFFPLWLSGEQRKQFQRRKVDRELVARLPTRDEIVANKERVAQECQFWFRTLADTSFWQDWFIVNQPEIDALERFVERLNLRVAEMDWSIAQIQAVVQTNNHLSLSMLREMDKRVKELVGRRDRLEKRCQRQRARLNELQRQAKPAEVDMAMEVNSALFGLTRAEVRQQQIVEDVFADSVEPARASKIPWEQVSSETKTSIACEMAELASEVRRSKKPVYLRLAGGNSIKLRRRDIDVLEKGARKLHEEAMTACMQNR